MQRTFERLASCLSCGVLTQAYSLMIRSLRLGCCFWSLSEFENAAEALIRRGCTIDEGHIEREGRSRKRSLKWRGWERIIASAGIHPTPISAMQDARAAVAKAYKTPLKVLTSYIKYYYGDDINAFPYFHDIQCP